MGDAVDGWSRVELVVVAPSCTASRPVNPPTHIALTLLSILLVLVSINQSWCPLLTWLRTLLPRYDFDFENFTVASILKLPILKFGSILEVSGKI